MNKQIESVCDLCAYNPPSSGDGKPCCMCPATTSEHINEGYRKASDVAREIFEEIEDVLNNIGYFDEIDFKALKKKYESEGADDDTL